MKNTHLSGETEKSITRYRVDTCFFCKSTKNLSREHVWPKWLRDVTPGAQRLLQTEGSGRRAPSYAPKIMLHQDGTYMRVKEGLGHIHTLLPEVTVKVCQACNNGWMSELEAAVKPILTPFLAEGEPIRTQLGRDQPLTVWALKTFMTYALSRGSQTNPFSRESYEQFRGDLTVPLDIDIWIASVDSPWSHVGLHMKTWTMGPPELRPDTSTDNCALGLLAVGGAVFLLVKHPEMAGHRIRPPQASPRKALRQLTRSKGRLRLHARLMSSEYMDALDDWMYTPDRFCRPFPEGLTEPERLEVATRWVKGLSPTYGGALHPHGQEAPEVDNPSIATTEVLETVERLRGDMDPATPGWFLIRTARRAFYEDDLKSAVLLLTRATQEPHFAEDANVAYLLAQCYSGLQDPKAIFWYRRCIALGNVGNESSWGLVEALTWDGQYSEALKEVRSIRVRSERDAVLRQANGLALSFLVDVLKLDYQDRQKPPRSVLSSEPGWAALKTFDAISPEVWQLMRGAALYAPSYFAWAWYGNTPFAWLCAAHLLSHFERGRRLAAFLRLGLDRCPLLYDDGEKLLGVLSECGLPMRSVKRALAAAAGARWQWRRWSGPWPRGYRLF